MNEITLMSEFMFTCLSHMQTFIRCVQLPSAGSCDIIFQFHLLLTWNKSMKCCFISSYETSPAYDLSNIHHKSVGVESTDMAGLTF